MTSAVVHPDSALERDPMRVLTITANLLPIEVTDARREHKMRWIVAAFLAVVVAGLGFWDYSARQQTDDATATLTRTQDQAAALKSQMNSSPLSDLVKTKQQNTALSGELTSLMTQDVAYYELVPTLRTTAGTAGVAITNLSVNLIDQTGLKALVVGTTPVTVGTISMIGVAPDKTKLAAYLDALAKVPGLANVTLTGFNAQGSQFQYSMQVDYTSALFKGRYTPASPTGGK